MSCLGDSRLASGAVAGLTACLLLQPLDLAKTRIQVGSPVHFSELWRGTVPTIWRNVPGTAFYFVCLEHLKYLAVLHGKRNAHLAVVDGQGRLSTTANAVIGATARALAGLVFMPFTVLKVRFESQHPARLPMWSVARAIVAADGIKGLFRGFGVTAVRDAPHAAIYVSWYEALKIDFSHRFDAFPLMINPSASLLAASLATVVTQPLDLVKTKVQVDKLKYPNMFRAFLRIADEDGMAGFYRGTLPRLLRKTLGTAVTWTVYEQLQRLGGSK